MCVKNENQYIDRLLNEGKDIPVDTEINPEKITLPPWYDADLFNKGQKYYTRNIFALFVANICGVIAVLAIPSILNVLSCTRKSSTSLTAYRRYIRTIFHIFTWHWCSFDFKEQSPESKAWKSITAVRKIHLTSSKFCIGAKNIIISQKDMALTQFGFMGFPTLKANLFGLNGDSIEFLEATTHFWRVIGYILGIKDEYNLCTNDWLTTKSRLESVVINVYQPALTTLSGECIEMITALIDGLWSFNPFLSVDAYIYVARRVAGCDGYEYLQSDYKTKEDETNGKKLYKNLNKYNRVVLYILVQTLQTLYQYKIFKWYFDLQIYLSLFLIYYFPFLAFPRFGFRKSYIRIFKK